MSSIDLSNPKVLRNFLLSQMREEKGELIYKEKVLVFKDLGGNEYVIPDEFMSDFEVVREDTNELLIETPEPEPVMDDTGYPKKTKKKKKVLVK